LSGRAKLAVSWLCDADAVLWKRNPMAFAAAAMWDVLIRLARRLHGRASNSANVTAGGTLAASCYSDDDRSGFFEYTEHVKRLSKLSPTLAWLPRACAQLQMVGSKPSEPEPGMLKPLIRARNACAWLPCSRSSRRPSTDGGGSGGSAGVPQPLLMCNGLCRKLARYCSSECQLRDFKSDGVHQPANLSHQAFERKCKRSMTSSGVFDSALASRAKK
jgi:hypothetical protein